MGLFGSKTTLTLEAEPVRLAPGDEIRSRITTGDPDKKAQDGHVRLLYVNTYRYESSDSDGDSTTSSATEDIVVAEAPLFGSGGTPAAGTFCVALHLPDDAPPSAADAVEYKLVAIVDRKAGRDVKEHVALQVASAPTAYADRAARPTEQPDELRAEIEAAPRELRAGETISGMVSVTARSGLEGRALRVRVRGIRRDQDGLTTVYDGEAQTLTEPANLAAGEPQSFPFAVQVPADARPTFDARHNALDWALEVFVDRRLRGDPTARLPLVVRSER